MKNSKVRLAPTLSLPLLVLVVMASRIVSDGAVFPFLQDNMSVVLVLFPNHTKHEPGFVVPSLAPDEEEQQKLQDVAAQEADISRRLSQLVNTAGAADGAPAPETPQDAAP